MSSPQDTTVQHGGCLCGRVRFQVTAAAIDSGYCHCRMCQRNTGAPVVAYTSFPLASFSWIGQPAGAYASSPQSTRRFCTACGSYLVFETHGAQKISVNTASLDHPADFAPLRHIYIESRIPWFEVADALPRYSGAGPS